MNTTWPRSSFLRERDDEELRSRIRYEYQPLDRGGRLHIITRDPQALIAVQDFLRFQIEDHATGDPTSME